jgi:hypothetical protein
MTAEKSHLTTAFFGAFIYLPSRSEYNGFYRIPEIKRDANTGLLW